MAGKKKETVTGAEIEYGQTGYAVTISEEGKEPVDGSFITDEDLLFLNQVKEVSKTHISVTHAEYEEYKDYKEKDETHTLISNIDLLEYQELKAAKEKGQVLDEGAHSQFTQLKEQAEKGKFIPDAELYEISSLEEANHGLQKRIDEFEKLKQTGQFITNDEAAEYQQFKKGKEEQGSKEEMQKQQAATIAINKLGANPVKAVTADGRQTNWSRRAWDELPFETDSKGKELKTKLGGWFVKADTPEEVKQFRSEQNPA